MPLPPLLSQRNHIGDRGNNSFQSVLLIGYLMKQLLTQRVFQQHPYFSSDTKEAIHPLIRRVTDVSVPRGTDLYKQQNIHAMKDKG